jgi:ubiquinone/menaquinone biosynthesis C-methylase UbiE
VDDREAVSVMRRRSLVIGLCALAVIPLAADRAAQQTGQLRRPDVIWVPTQDPVVNAMLKMAKVTKDDVVYDLGCGDGKIVIAAARQYGARGVGVDIDPQRIQEANANAEKAGVTDKVTFILGDIFDPSLKISEASVVTLYLLERLNIQLKPRLLAELKPGTRIVSNTFKMGDDWPPEQTESVNSYQIHFWTIPKR